MLRRGVWSITYIAAEGAASWPWVLDLSSWSAKRHHRLLEVDSGLRVENGRKISRIFFSSRLNLLLNTFWLFRGLLDLIKSWVWLFQRLRDLPLLDSLHWHLLQELLLLLRLLRLACFQLLLQLLNLLLKLVDLFILTRVYTRLAQCLLHDYSTELTLGLTWGWCWSLLWWVRWSYNLLLDLSGFGVGVIIWLRLDFSFPHLQIRVIFVAVVFVVVTVSHGCGSITIFTLEWHKRTFVLNLSAQVKFANSV